MKETVLGDTAGVTAKTGFFNGLKVNSARRLFLAMLQLLYHSHKKRKESLETWAVLLLIFSLNLKYLGWLYSAYIKTAKNGGFCEELLSENDFEAVLATFCCYDHGANTSKAVQKIATDQKEHRKCSSCVIIY